MIIRVPVCAGARRNHKTPRIDLSEAGELVIHGIHLQSPVQKRHPSQCQQSLPNLPVFRVFPFSQSFTCEKGGRRRSSMRTPCQQSAADRVLSDKELRWQLTSASWCHGCRPHDLGSTKVRDSCSTETDNGRAVGSGEIPDRSGRSRDFPSPRIARHSGHDTGKVSQFGLRIRREPSGDQHQQPARLQACQSLSSLHSCRSRNHRQRKVKLAPVTSKSSRERHSDEERLVERAVDNPEPGRSVPSRRSPAPVPPRPGMRNSSWNTNLQSLK